MIGMSHSDLLSWAFADEEALEIFSVKSTAEALIDVEIALALAQADVGAISRDEADVIAEVLQSFTPDMAELRRGTRNVGYPVLPLIDQLIAALPPGPGGRVHLGATTQDVMDSALMLQLSRVVDRQLQLVREIGSALAELSATHVTTLMPGRTHGQQAVPITLGGKLAVFLSEFSRQAQRLLLADESARLVSLYGAAGTSAALGPDAADIRERLAQRLGLRNESVPWHVSRDGIATLAFQMTSIANSCRRLASEVINLSRTEIGEVSEQEGYLRGASSTMPQKNNPILSEVVVGYSTVAASLLSGIMDSTGHVIHERASGEWHAEWFLLPQICISSTSTLKWTSEILTGLNVHTARMRENLGADGGAIAAEAVMFALAKTVGREEAHELVYRAVRRARENGADFIDLIASENGLALDALRAPESHAGESDIQISSALADWSQCIIKLDDRLDEDTLPSCETEVVRRGDETLTE